jgi:plasmid maintenance system antidote protein VapI
MVALREVEAKGGIGQVIDLPLLDPLFSFISPNRIAEIVNNRRRITADTALRLGLYFGTSAEFWMNLQSRYDLKMARRHLTPEEADRIKAQRAA